MSKKTHRNEITVLLHNIRSAHNVGAIFRTAEAAGVSELWLTGYTPTPYDKFGRKRSDISKAALGAEDIVRWRHASRIGTALAKLKKGEFQFVAVEQHPQARNYHSFVLQRPTCFLFGNEVRGLSPRIVERCDAVIHIPLLGRKESLNVSVAAGIVLFNTNRANRVRG